MKISEMSGATMRRLIVKRALEIGDDYATRSAEASASGDIGLANHWYGMANGAWAVVKAIRHGSFKPVRRPKSGRSGGPAHE